MGHLMNITLKTVLFSITIMIILCCSNQVQAEQDEDYTYTVTDCKVQITGYNGDGGDVVIPDKLGGFSVTSIGNAAFYGCSGLTSISIPQGVTSIGYMAFHGCTGLTSIIIPQGVTYISEQSFAFCTGLTSITVDMNNSAYASVNGVLYNKAKTILMVCPGGLTSIAIPQGITSIGNSAFCGCTSLTSITIPQGVTSIGNSAFSGCNVLTSVSIPQGVASIGSGAFYGCSGLTSITIPQEVTSIGTYSFHGCTGLTNVNIPQSVTSIGEQSFSYCTGLTSITVDMNNSAYASVNGVLYNKAKTTLVAWPGSLTSITIPQGVTSIGDSAFCGCTGLTSITIPQEITSIGNSAFSGCTGLTSISIPQGVTSMGNSALYGCTGLTSITFNSATTVIDDSEYTIPAETKIIGYDPSTAKDYATKYSRTFEVISSTQPIDECFIATAAFGSKFEPAVVILRHFRDQFLLTNKLGTAFVKFYYHNSPPIAAYIAQSEPLKVLVRLLLIPIIAAVYSIMHPTVGVGCIIVLALILATRKRRINKIRA